MSEEHHIKTDFMDRQARESATPFMQKFPVRVMMVLLAVGILYGGYNLVMYCMNLEKNQAINNVGVTLQEPDLQDGVARVDVTISNLNAVPVDHIQFKYTINGPDGNAAATGLVAIPELIPTGASRTFRHVKLGPLQGEAARMKAELVDLKVGPKSTLPAGLDSRFTEILTLKPAESIPAFTEFVGQAPNFAPGFIGLGRAYLADGNDSKARDAFEKAVKLDPKSADAHYALGLALLGKNARATAEKEIGIAYDLAPNDPDIQKTISENRK
jgi:tetratricopeptide (TPR) repeat protein